MRVPERSQFLPRLQLIAAYRCRDIYPYKRGSKSVAQNAELIYRVGMRGGEAITNLITTFEYAFL